MAKRKSPRVSAKTKKPIRKASKAKPKAAAGAAPPKGKWVYGFGGGRAEGKPNMRNLLGGKGAGLAEMANLGLPVPPGFTITTEVCTYYYANKQQYPKELRAQVEKALAQVGRITGKIFGDKSNPLLVSVRSGARASMPGMMDTVLNLGLNDETVTALAKKSGDRRFAYDSYRRFITMYSDVVLGVGHEHFEELLDRHKERQGYSLDTDLTADDWAELVELYKKRLQQERGEPFPQDPHEQLVGRDRRGVRVLDEPARQHLPPPAQYSGKLGHRGQRAGHGVRQYGRQLGDRRRLHAQSVHRREEAVRRIPHQRAGRGRGRRHPHAAGNQRGGARRGRLRQAVDGEHAAQGLCRAQAHLQRARAPLPRHAGPRIHGRAGQAVDAADPLGQAHRQGRAAHRGRTRQRRPDLQERSGAARRSAGARSAAASDHRSARAPQRDRHRPAGVARRCLRRDRVLARRGGAAQSRRQEGDPGAGRDLARGHPRHARGRRHPHHPRRHDLACGGGRARHGQALRLRRRLAARRLCRGHHDGRRTDVQERRLSSPSTAPPARCWPARST